MKKGADYLVLLIFISIIFTFYATFILGQKGVSESENRILAKLEIFQMKDFLDKTFQNNLEESIADQIVISENLKKNAIIIRKDIINSLNKLILKIRNKPDRQYYVSIAENTFEINNDDYLLVKNISRPYNEKAAQYFNSIENIDKYFYCTESCSLMTYDNKYNENHMYEDIIRDVELTGSAKLDVTTYEKYKQYFYKTDHHWNYKGQYQGYKDIIKLLGIPEGEQVKVTEEKQYNVYFFGSRAKNTMEYNIKEKFTVYKYDNAKPKKTYIDGKIGKYGKSDEYDKGEYETKDITNHYGDYYGWDNGEVIFDFDSQDKENLLIIANSYSNALNEIIASHFNKTYIIDLRQNPEFRPNEYIQEHQIDKLLIIGGTDLFTDAYFKNVDLSNFE